MVGIVNDVALDILKKAGRLSIVDQHRVIDRDPREPDQVHDRRPLHADFGQHGLRGFALTGSYPFAVVDVPLLYETGHAGDFDRVIVTTCPPELQMVRLRGRGMEESEARQRLAAQWPTDEKAGRADFIVHTDGSFEETDKQVDRIYRALRG